MEMDKTMHGSRELEFAIFCIENVASKVKCGCYQGLCLP